MYYIISKRPSFKKYIGSVLLLRILTRWPFWRRPVSSERTSPCCWWSRRWGLSWPPCWRLSCCQTPRGDPHLPETEKSERDNLSSISFRCSFFFYSEMFYMWHGSYLHGFYHKGISNFHPKGVFFFDTGNTVNKLNILFKRVRAPIERCTFKLSYIRP